jgi:hypothetical protein
MLTQADASGGAGSSPVGGLWDALAGGIKLVAAGELSRRYGFSFGADGNVAVNADGTIKQAAAPSRDATAGDYIANALKNPLVLVGAVAALALVVVLVRRG